MKKTNILINKTEIKETKDLIIDCAGKLIAKYGYADVTGKSICKSAKINMTAINYHFGSRNGLYLAVLEKAYNFLLNIDKLDKLYLSNLAAGEKIEAFIDILTENLSNEKIWYLKVWVRELVNPSPFLEQVLAKKTLPQLDIVSKIFSEYTKLPVTNPKLYSCILNTVSPFIVTFLAHNTAEFFPVKYSKKELVSHLKKLVFTGLDEFSKIY